MKLQDDEEQALRNASMLVRYAAESPKTLDDTIISPISNAWKAQEDDSWNSDIATKFWAAYSSLCTLIKPVTIDTISTAQPIKVKPWFSKEYMETTKPRIIAGRYELMLFILLCFSIVLGFRSTVITTMDNDLKDFVKRGETAAADSEKASSAIKLDLQKVISENEDPLEISLDDKRIGVETAAKINELRDKLMDMWYAADMMEQRTRRMANITWFISPIKGYEPGDLSRLPKLSNGYYTIQNFYQWRRAVSESRQQVFMVNSFYLAFVPMLLGAMGACTYVLRSISDEIRDTRFSSTSPVVHSSRVILGALAGVVVGLGGIVAAGGLGLSNSALAFIAGYAVEPVFATLDAIAEKFKRTA